jgi:hypothetical protein
MKTIHFLFGHFRIRAVLAIACLTLSAAACKSEEQGALVLFKVSVAAGVTSIDEFELSADQGISSRTLSAHTGLAANPPFTFGYFIGGYNGALAVTARAKRGGCTLGKSRTVTVAVMAGIMPIEGPELAIEPVDNPAGCGGGGPGRDGPDGGGGQPDVQGDTSKPDVPVDVPDDRSSLLGNGSACVTDAECTSGACSLGVCCDRACTGVCESCAEPDSKGTCTLVVGEPRTKRPACGGAMCMGASFVGQGICDGSAATCVALERPCGGYACDPAMGCKTSCTVAADCQPTHYCQLAGASGTCTVKVGDGTPCQTAEQCPTGDCKAYFRDDDGDGHSSSTMSMVCGGVDAPAGFSSVNDEDCCDRDAGAFKCVAGRPCDFQPQAQPTGCGTWDYNCDDESTPSPSMVTKATACAGGESDCQATAGEPLKPACGPFTYQGCVWDAAQSLCVLGDVQTMIPCY